MSKQVLPQPPSPTTTIFFEKAGIWDALVAAVVSEPATSDADDMVLTVPLLVRMLWCLAGLRRGDREPETEPRSDFRLSGEPEGESYMRSDILMRKE